MTQEDMVRAENESNLRLIHAGQHDEAYDRAIRNVDAASTTGSDALEGNCAYTLGRAAHESGRLSVAIMAYARAAGKARRLGNWKAFGDIQISLATAFLEVSDGERKDNLEKAVACQVNALDTHPEETHPLDYAKLQYNMGYAYTELTQRFGQPYSGQAKRCFENARRAFHKLGDSTYARKAGEALDALASGKPVALQASMLKRATKRPWWRFW